MAEVTPKLVLEGVSIHPLELGDVTLDTGEVCPVIVRIAAGLHSICYVDLSNEFRCSLHSKPQAALVIADELTAMLRDAILREFVATVVS